MATILSKRPQGSLPSTSKVNPRKKRKEHCKGITLRSGREVAASGPPPMIAKEPKQSDHSEIEIGITQEDGDQPQLNNSTRK